MDCKFATSYKSGVCTQSTVCKICKPRSCCDVDMSCLVHFLVSVELLVVIMQRMEWEKRENNITEKNKCS